MVNINHREIGQGQPTYIVLEAGPTHYGLESACELVDIASESGADAIKFQYVDADRLMGDKDVIFTYQVLSRDGQQETVKEPLYEILKRRGLAKEEWKTLKKYCNQKNITFYATAMYKDEVDFLVDELEVDSIKVASLDVNYLDFIEYIASKQVNIQLDTGSADLWEIERAVCCIENQNNHNIIIHHCPSGYPARLESIHLNMIPTLMEMFPNYGIAFSDHTPGWEMDIAAVAKGAVLVEKTITLDRTIRSCEHMFSLEPREVRKFVKSIRDLEAALGQARRVIPRDIKENRKAGRRSLFMKHDTPEGSIITKDMVEYRRPGTGILPEEWNYVKGKKLTRSMSAGKQLMWDDLQ